MATDFARIVIILYWLCNRLPNYNVFAVIASSVEGRIYQMLKNAGRFLLLLLTVSSLLTVGVYAAGEDEGYIYRFDLQELIEAVGRNADTESEESEAALSAVPALKAPKALAQTASVKQTVGPKARSAAKNVRPFKSLSEIRPAPVLKAAPTRSVSQTAPESIFALKPHNTKI